MHSQQASIRAARLTKIAMDCVPDALSGRTLYGDDFSPKQIARWFSEEEEAYYRLARRNGSYCYYYHARNIEHGYRHLPRQEFGRVLGIGSAYGDELAPYSNAARLQSLNPRTASGMNASHTLSRTRRARCRSRMRTSTSLPALACYTTFRM